jgi:hypothetical protein
VTTDGCGLPEAHRGEAVHQSDEQDEGEDVLTGERRPDVEQLEQRRVAVDGGTGVDWRPRGPRAGEVVPDESNVGVEPDGTGREPRETTQAAEEAGRE